MPAKDLTSYQLADMAKADIERKKFLSPENQPIIDYFEPAKDLEGLVNLMKLARKIQVKNGEWLEASVKFHFNKKFNEIKYYMQRNYKEIYRPQSEDLIIEDPKEDIED